MIRNYETAIDFSRELCEGPMNELQWIAE